MYKTRRLCGDVSVACWDQPLVCSAAIDCSIMFKKIISYLPIKRKPAGEEVGEIESITIYPLKSGKGITVNAAKTTNSGLKLSKTDIYDR